MEHWLLYFLMFLFGFMTHKTFYFLRALRLSLALIKVSHVIYLSSVIKALEHLSYAREMMLEHMARTDQKSASISAFEFRFDEEIRALKTRSINVIIKNHPSFFRPVLEFEDWPTAMKYLESHRESALHFWGTRND
jgi:hypothetical protein